MTPLDRLVAIEDIRRLIVLYAQLLDAGRFDDWADLFTKDAEFWSVPGHHLPGNPEIARLRGRAEIVASVNTVRDEMRRKGGAVLHFGGVPLIVPDGDRAEAWWDFVIVATGDGPATIPFAGQYATRLVREDGLWRFASRVSVRAGYAFPDGVLPAPAAARRL